VALQSVSSNPAPSLKPRYSKALRCIGQGLEQVGLKALEVKTHGENYIVQAWKKGTSSSLDHEKHYTPDDLRALEQEGRTKRESFPSRLTPMSLSQMLRMAGNYVDLLRGRLVRVSWQDQSDRIQSITIQYEPFSIERGEGPDSHLTTIEELCIHIYKQRKKITLASEKTSPRPAVGAGKSR
jgi:hypothetical protein